MLPGSAGGPPAKFFVENLISYIQEHRFIFLSKLLPVANKPDSLCGRAARAPSHIGKRTKNALNLLPAYPKIIHTGTIARISKYFR